MDIIKWSPFGDVDKFFEDDFFSVLPAVSKRSYPSMNVYQTEKDVVAEVSLAGVDPKDVEISMKNDVLTVQGKTSEEKEKKEKDYYCKEIRSGSFLRSFSLPASVKEDEARAESKDGILKITIPKDEKKITNRIPIRVVKK